MKVHRMDLKIVVVGERGVGKTSLIERYTKGRFAAGTEGSLGARLYPVSVELRPTGQDPILAKVAVFDLMGEHSARGAFRDALFFKTHGVLAVCDLERPGTLYSLQEWIQAIASVTGGVPFHIAMNKADRADGIPVDRAAGDWLREQFPLVHATRTSARTGEGVEEAFSDVIHAAAEEVAARMKRRREERLLRHRILDLAVRRETLGVSERELMQAFTDWTHAEIAEQVDVLSRLDLVVLDEGASRSFVADAREAKVFHLRATAKGRQAAADPTVDDFVAYDEA